MTAVASLSSLRAAVNAHAGSVDAEFGVFIHHLSSGATIGVNDGKLYLLASVFKIPILLEALAQVEEGRLRLDERMGA
jgi:beta-lactamase class A